MSSPYRLERLYPHDGVSYEGFNPNRTIVHAESPQLAQEKPGFNGKKLNKQPLNREPGTLNLSYLYQTINQKKRQAKIKLPKQKYGGRLFSA